MSSNEDEYNDDNNAGGYQKKRRIQRACDICRRKKIRCDGVQMPGNRCSNCIAYSFDCTYVEAAKKRGPPKGYVESLENRVEKLEKLLKRLCPDEALYKKLTDSLDNNWMAERTPFDPSSLVASCSTTEKRTLEKFGAQSQQGSSLALQSVTNAIRGVADDFEDGMADDEEDTALILADNLKRMEIEPKEYRFFGKSSGAMLIRTALELKNEYTGSDLTIPDLQKKPLKNLRAEFWTQQPWERNYVATQIPQYDFPEPEFSKHLVDLYFRHVNLHLPLLNRCIFEKWIEEGLHLTNRAFAPVYLLVCAVGARYSSDPRAMLDGVNSTHSCGWKWFDQVQMVKKSPLSAPTLFDLQVYCLAVQFLQGSSAPQSCWTIVGIGIRLAQDVGAHRKKVHTHKLTAEDEMWKRAFWVLVCIDRMVSSSLGRPCAIQDEDFDLELPIDCDDEYWEHPDPEQRFKQPPGKPSRISFFILYLKLHQILAFSLRTIYSINKSKVLLGFVGQQWEQHIVAELDSALNKWVDSVPDHLRWDPSREDESFFAQSVSLYAAYYHIQILIHRPFIPSPSKPSPLSFPSLAICTNAARSCCHVVDIQRRRNGVSTPHIQMSVFTSGIVLLLSIWGGKRSGLSTDPVREMAEVHKCMEVLRTSEIRWHSAGRLWDILYELASVGDLPLPKTSPPATNKRERDSDTPISTPPSDTSAQKQASPEPMLRNIAGSRRVNKEGLTTSTTTNMPPFHPQPHPPTANPTGDPNSPMAHHSPSNLHTTPHSLSRRSSQSQLAENSSSRQSYDPVQYYALPVYSNELGSLPLHGQVAFSTEAPVPQPATLLQPGGPHWSLSLTPSSSGASSESSGGANFASSSKNANTAGYPPIGEMSSMTTGYEMDAAAMAAGMMLDTMAGSLAYNAHHQHQQHGTHQGGQFSRPIFGVGYGMSGIEGHGHGVQDGGSMDGFRGLAADMTGSGGMGDGLGSRSTLGQQLNQPRQEQSQQQDLTYPFVDNDTIAMWSTAPTGFELDEWGTYLTNVSELTQHCHQPPSGAGNTDGMPQQQ